MPNNSKCLECKKAINGRSDKKFCDDGCRNTFNNRVNSINNLNINKINGILRKNRKIIQSLLPNDETTNVSEKTMRILGFNFDYITNIYTTKTGSVYHFCYEFGYLAVENNRFMLVKKKENNLAIKTNKKTV